MYDWPEFTSLNARIVESADRIWEYAELAHQEIKSSALLVDWLKDEGFEVVARGVADLETSWVARYGSGAPVIGILTEFDALPGLGNEAVCSQTPREDGVTTGHGCGHNLIGSGATGAAVALKRRMEKEGVPGTLMVFGCPAEELLIGKSLMAKAGSFDGLDACLHWHPLNITTAFNFSTVACADFEFVWHGKTAHSGASPWEGRSAMHALELFVHGVNAMREHIVPDARMHYHIVQASEAINIVPDYSKIQVRYRGPDAENVRINVEWLKQIANGAAMMTQTVLEDRALAGTFDCNNNQSINARILKHMQHLDAPVWTPEEQMFAKEIQKESSVPQDGLGTCLTPDPAGAPMGGSSDVGDVSNITPTGGAIVACWPLNIPPHHWGCTASNGMSIGHKGMLYAARVLALAGWDLLTDKELLGAAKEEFLKTTEGKPYQSLI
ncbi:MAG: amidohydrolase [Desulfuromonadales bacterium]|nr:amidohydrolase [Desulfuromonadales bacterium]